MEHVAARLDTEDFAKLVAGEAVSLTGYTNGREVRVKLILADIGWGQMLHVMRAAMERAVAQPELVDDPEVRAMAYRIKRLEPVEDEPCILPPGDPLKV